MDQGASKGTILVVDDSASICDLLTRILEKEGYAVLTASGGKEGLALARAHAPDLVILDIMMEDMDGSEVASALRETPRTAGIPIIYLTGLMTPDEAAHASGRYGDLVVAKPFDTPELLGHIARKI